MFEESSENAQFISPVRFDKPELLRIQAQILCSGLAGLRRLVIRAA